MAADEKNFFDTVEKKYTNLIFSHKDSYWGPLLMLNLFSYLTPEQRPMYEQFTTEAKNSYYGKKVYQELFFHPSPFARNGDKQREFEGEAFSHRLHSLSLERKN